MQDLRGKVAVVTGGGSGIGEGLVSTFADEGMHVVVADIDEREAVRVAGDARARGIRAMSVRTDVAEARSVEALAEAVYTEFGETHVLCNNAGVLLMGPIAEKRADDWRWVFSVNVFGLVHGLQSFLPRMKEQDGPSHIVNTSSVAALGGEGVYGASKAAVFAISESLRAELEPAGIGVSVLCPAYINSKILDAQRNRPAEFGPRANEPLGTAEVTTGLAATAVGRATVAAIRQNRLYVFTLPESMRKRVQPHAKARFDEILDAIEAGVEPDAS